MKKLLLRTLLMVGILSCASAKMDCSSLSGGGGNDQPVLPNTYSIKYDWHVYRVRTSDTTYFDTSYSLKVMEEYDHNGPNLRIDTAIIYRDIYGAVEFYVGGDYNVPDTVWLHLNISKAGLALADTVVVDTMPRADTSRVFYYKL
jgi:hypothetical protein